MIFFPKVINALKYNGMYQYPAPDEAGMAWILGIQSSIGQLNVSFVTAHLHASSCQQHYCIKIVSLWPAVICVPHKKRIFVSFSNWEFLIFCVFTSICRLVLLTLVSSCVLCCNWANDWLNWLFDRSIDLPTNSLTKWPSEGQINESISCGYNRKSFGGIQLIWLFTLYSFSHDFSPKCTIICKGVTNMRTCLNQRTLYSLSLSLRTHFRHAHTKYVMPNMS